MWREFYYFINKIIIDNRIKEFKYKTLHLILAINLNLFKWNIEKDPLCKSCNKLEDFEHFFIYCQYLDTFWAKVDECFRNCGYHRSFRNLQNLIFGYKLEILEYQPLNMLLNIIAYCIYKTYFKSERRTKSLNIINILYYDILIIVKYYENKNVRIDFLKQFQKFLKS